MLKNSIPRKVLNQLRIKKKFNSCFTANLSITIFKNLYVLHVKKYHTEKSFKQVKN